MHHDNMPTNQKQSHQVMNAMMNYILTMASKPEPLSWQQAIKKAMDAILTEKDILKYWHYILLGSIDAKKKGVVTKDAAFFHITQAAGMLCDEIVYKDYLSYCLERQMRAIEKREGLKDGQSFNDYDDSAIPPDWTNALRVQGKRLEMLHNNYLDKILRTYGETALADIVSKKKDKYERLLQAGGKRAYLKPDPFVQCLKKARKCLPKNSFIQAMTAEWRVEKVV